MAINCKFLLKCELVATILTSPKFIAVLFRVMLEVWCAPTQQNMQLAQFQLGQ